MLKKPTLRDAYLLCFFTFFITLHPFFLQGQLNLYELGIYLPGIQAILDGAIPYRDFFYERGPLELYIPTVMMILGGVNMAWLPVFFYTGTILTLIAAIFIALEIFRSRIFLYIFVPVFIGRTFPRVSYYYWGGFRYFIGLLALYFVILAVKNKRLKWMFWAGLCSCLALFTTIEAGVSTMLAIAVAAFAAHFFRMIERKFIWQALKQFLVGFCVVFIPYVIFMIVTGSLKDYLETTCVIMTKMSTTLSDPRGTVPEGFWGIILGLWPGSPFFKYLTPIYFFLVVLAYLVFKVRKGLADWRMLSIILIAIYGLILYAASFRVIAGHHFEMAFQPQKIIYFFFLEEFFFFNIELGKRREMTAVHPQGFWRRKLVQCQPCLAKVFLLMVIASSLGYAIHRYNHRFVSFKLLKEKFFSSPRRDFSLLAGQEKRVLTTPRAAGMVVPKWQGEEIEAVIKFIGENTRPHEPVFTYLELGNYNFWFDRPCVGRFPIVSFSWFHDKWHQEVIHGLLKERPQYAILTNVRHRTMNIPLYFR